MNGTIEMFIPRNRGYSIIIDIEDHTKFMSRKWRIDKREPYIRSADQEQINLSNFLLALKGLIDHKDRKPLNNSKSNYRLCTHQQNMFNQSKRNNTSSKYIGVNWCIKKLKWKTQIGFKGKRIHIGLFNSEIDAALAYDRKAKKLFSEFANPNFTIT